MSAPVAVPADYSNHGCVQKNGKQAGVVSINSAAGAQAGEGPENSNSPSPALYGDEENRAILQVHPHAEDLQDSNIGDQVQSENRNCLHPTN